MNLFTLDQVLQLREMERAQVRDGGVGFRVELQELIVRLAADGSSAVASTEDARQGSTRTNRTRAEKVRKRFERWYHSLGFRIAVPVLHESNREITRRQKLGQTPVYRPASHEVSYEAFMTAVGQGSHWTVTDQADRAKIGWEPTATGYWFWAEVQDACPRLKTSRNNLMATIRLLSLEEYVIVWHAVKHLQKRMLDRNTWCWLRTSFGPSGSLNADGYVGCVRVYRYSADDLAIADDNGGGRVADVVAEM